LIDRPNANAVIRRFVIALILCLFVPTYVKAADGLWPPRVPSGTALVVGDQNEVLQTVMAASGEQARLAEKVTYANFLGGPAVLEAFRAGALDLVTIGNTPPIQAQGAGERILIVAAWQLSGRSMASPCDPASSRRTVRRP
jgi:sulfonate transport system substrate-binding protein